MFYTLSNALSNGANPVQTGKTIRPEFLTSPPNLHFHTMNFSFRLLPLALLLACPLFAQKPTGLPSSPEPKPSPAAERMTALDKRKLTEEHSLTGNIGFRNVGPTVMSGRVVDLEVNPNDPTNFYAAYASGGLWFTESNGTYFTPVFDNNPLIDIGDIAVSWGNGGNRNTSPNTIWVGTGECNSSRSSYAGTGVYKSMDGGKTWQHKGLPESHHIGKIIINPDDANTVFVAVAGHLYSPNKERGVFKTSDGGETWKQVLFIDENTGVIDLFADPNNARTLFAIAWHRERRAWNFTEGGKSTGIYKSTDGGESWKLISGVQSGLPQGDNVGRMGLAIFPGNSSIMYTIVDNQGQDATKKDATDKKTPPLSSADFRTMDREQFLALEDERLQKFLDDYGFPEKYSASAVTEMVRSNKIQPVSLADFVSDANSDLFSKPIIGAEVYRSDDGGNSWKKVNTVSLEGLFYTYGYYFGKIWVSPFSADEVFIAGVSLMQSKNGGKTFSSIDGDNQHGDHHALWLNPSRKNHLINGNDGGINITWDNGKSWFKANTPAVAQFYAVNIDMAKPYNVYGGLQDNGVWYGPSNYRASTEWLGEGHYPYTRILGGDGMQVQVDPRDNNTVYTGYQFGHYFRVDKTTFDSKEIRPTMELGDKPLRFNWQAPIWLSVHNPDILYMGAQKLFRSMDKGDHFTAISGDQTRGGRTGDVPYGTISTIHESPMKFGLLYTGSDDGLIHVSKNGGETWTRISDKLPQHLRVNRVIASAHAEGRVYAVLSGFQWDHFQPYVYVSEDYGNSWTRIATDLPMEPVNVIREDPVNENLLFIGTDFGLYASINRGKSCMRMTNGLPPVAIHDLVIQPREHDLVVGTHGRSIFIANISELEKLSDSIVNQPLYVFEPVKVKQNASYELVDGDYIPVTNNSIRLSWYANAGGPTVIRLKSADGNETFALMRDTSEKGLNFYNGTIFADSAHAAAYKSWAMKNGTKDEIVELPNGCIALKPGDYTIEVESAGTIRQVMIKVRKPDDSSGASHAPEGPGERRKD